MKRRSILTPALLLYFITGTLLVSGQLKALPYQFPFCKRDSTENSLSENLKRHHKKEVRKNSDYRRAAERICGGYEL